MHCKYILNLQSLFYFWCSLSLNGLILSFTLCHLIYALYIMSFFFLFSLRLCFPLYYMGICYMWTFSPSFAHRHTKSHGLKGKLTSHLGKSSYPKLIWWVESCPCAHPFLVYHWNKDLTKVSLPSLNLIP